LRISDAYGGWSNPLLSAVAIVQAHVRREGISLPLLKPECLITTHFELE